MWGDKGGVQRGDCGGVQGWGGFCGRSGYSTWYSSSLEETSWRSRHIPALSPGWDMVKTVMPLCLPTKSAP